MEEKQRKRNKEKDGACADGREEEGSIEGSSIEHNGKAEPRDARSKQLEDQNEKASRQAEEEQSKG